MESDEPLEMTVKIKEGVFFISIPGEGLVASGKDWDSAYQVLRSKVKSIKVVQEKRSSGDIEPPVRTAKQDTDPHMTSSSYQMLAGGVVSFFFEDTICCRRSPDCSELYR